MPAPAPTTLKVPTPAAPAPAPRAPAPTTLKVPTPAAPAPAPRTPAPTTLKVPAPAAPQPPSPIVSVPHGTVGDWRIVEIVKNGVFSHCATGRRGPAGDLWIAQINDRDWSIAVPAGGRRGKVEAYVGAEQLTLQANGQLAWWVVPNVPYFGEPGEEIETMTIDVGATGENVMEWSLERVSRAIEAVARCREANAR